MNLPGFLGEVLKERSRLLLDGDLDLLPLPPADERGHYPAIETARAISARQVIRDRKTVG